MNWLILIGAPSQLKETINDQHLSTKSCLFNTHCIESIAHYHERFSWSLIRLSLAWLTALQDPKERRSQNMPWQPFSLIYIFHRHSTRHAMELWHSMTPFAFENLMISVSYNSHRISEFVPLFIDLWAEWSTAYSCTFSFWKSFDSKVIALRLRRLKTSPEYSNQKFNVKGFGLVFSQLSPKWEKIWG